MTRNGVFKALAHEGAMFSEVKLPGYVAFRPTKRSAAAHAVEMFEREQLPGMDVSALRGKTLMCWCGLDEPCHGDPILKKANR